MNRPRPVASPRPRRARRVAVLLAAAVLSAPLGDPLSSVAAAAPAPADPLSLRVTSVSPTTPLRTNTPRPLVISFLVTNTTGRDLPAVSVIADRAAPIGTQAALDGALSATGASNDAGKPVPATRPVTVSVPPHGTVAGTFATTTSLQDDGKGLCLCANAVYPIVLSAHTVTAGIDERLGAVTTFVTSVFKPLAHPVDVAWVWPLIDRPHRVLDDTVFTDDELSASVRAGGRLDKSLQVVERVAALGTIPMRLVVDPELLDELEVMAAGKYVVRAPGTTTNVPGTGTADATQWLTRFIGLLNSDSAITVSLTPYGDPDVLTLRQSDLSWSPLLPAPMSERVAQALGGHDPQPGFAWPPSDAVDRRTLDTMVDDGVGTVLLGSQTVNPSTSGGSPAASATIRANGHDVTALLTSPAIEHGVDLAVRAGDLGALPALAAEVSIRALQDPGTANEVVLSPPRYVDPDVATAVDMISATTQAPFATPASVTGLAAAPQRSVSMLRHVSSARSQLPGAITSALTGFATNLPVLQDLLSKAPAAQPLLDSLPAAIQRLGSAAWRPDVGVADSALGSDFADRLQTQLQELLTGMHIVKPSSGSYTLASANASLPITVQNTLPYPILVRVDVTVRNALPGYTSRGSGAKVIQPNSKVIVQVPSRVERSGRIAVQAQLETSRGVSLGKPVALSVHSTIFGVIGIVITVVAGSVLVLALLLRFARRLMARPRKERSTASRTAAVGAGGSGR